MWTEKNNKEICMQSSYETYSPGTGVRVLLSCLQIICIYILYLRNFGLIDMRKSQCRDLYKAEKHILCTDQWVFLNFASGEHRSMARFGRCLVTSRYVKIDLIRLVITSTAQLTNRRRESSSDTCLHFGFLLRTFIYRGHCVCVCVCACVCACAGVSEHYHYKAFIRCFDPKWCTGENLIVVKCSTIIVCLAKRLFLFLI